MVSSALGVVAALVAGALTAPATASSSPVRCPPGARGQITEAFATVFSRTDATDTPAEQRAARVVGGDDPELRSLLERWLLDPAGRSSTVSVVNVRCQGRRRAVVDTELVLAGVPLPEVLPRGATRLEGGTWKVARRTFCARLALEDPEAARVGPCARRI